MNKFLSAVAVTTLMFSSNTVFAMGETNEGEVKFTTNKDVWGGQWVRVKGKFNEKFGKLTHDEKMVERGDRQQIAGLMREKYGWTQVEAEEKLDEFVKANDHNNNMTPVMDNAHHMKNGMAQDYQDAHMVDHQPSNNMHGNTHDVRSNTMKNKTTTPASQDEKMSHNVSGKMVSDSDLKAN